MYGRTEPFPVCHLHFHEFHVASSDNDVDLAETVVELKNPWR